MPRAGQRVNYSNFGKGVVSDSNPIASPENAARVLQNVDISLSGKAGRRLGIEPEENFNLPVDINNNSSDWLSGNSLSDIASSGIDTYSWDNVDNTSGLSYRVLRIRNTLYIYNEGGAVLSDSHIRTIDISPYATNATTAAEAGFQAASGKGLLLCVGTQYNPFYIKHDLLTDTWTDVAIDIQIRDFEGVEDDLPIDEDPSALTPTHQYNLHNQGWPDYTVRDTSGTMKLPHEHYYSQSGAYPANSKIWFFGNTPDGSLIKFNASDVNSTFFGNSLAPRGHFIIDPFDGASRGEVSGLGGLIQGNSPTSRPSSVQFFAGRAWYASVEGVIFYSKIIEQDADLGICYQQQDPTAEELNALLDTDGGTLPILDIGAVEGMSPIGDALVIMGANGIWAISGGDSGFTANTQLLYNVSKVGVVNYRSIVSAEDSVLLWSPEGIYVVHTGERGTLQATSLSENRIQRDYNEIPGAAQAYAQGAYDRKDRKVYWSYSFHTEELSSDVRQKYTDVLVYSIPLNAFWSYRLSNEGFTSSTADYPIMGGIFSPSVLSEGSLEENVTAASSAVVFTPQDPTPTQNTPAYLEGDLSGLSSSASTDELYSLSHCVLGDTGKALSVKGSGTYEIWATEDGGVTWTLVTSDYRVGSAAEGESINTNVQYLAYSPSLDRVVLVNRSYGILYSDDQGATWTTALDWRGNTAYWRSSYGLFSNSVVWDETSGQFITWASDWAATFRSSADYGSIVSSDGISWSGVTGGFSVSGGSEGAIWYPIVWLPDQQRAVYLFPSAVSVYGLFSDDFGATWTEIATPGHGENFTSTSGRRVGYSQDQSKLIAQGATGTTSALVSTDYGVTWALDTASGGAGISHPVWAPLQNLWFDVSTGEGYYSTDGLTWSTLTAEAALTTYISAFEIEISGAQVTDSGEPVTINVPTAQYADQNVKVITLLPDTSGNLRPTFGQFSSRAFEDWDTLDSASLSSNVNYTASFPVAAMDSGNYTSTIETLPLTLNEPSLNKQATYLHTYYDYVRGGYNELEVPEEFDT